MSRHRSPLSTNEPPKCADLSFPVIFAPEAEEQLIALYRYIAQASSPEITERFTSAIVEHCEKLASFPERGTPRGDLRPNLRTLAFRRRVTIAYAAETDQVAILGIFYGGQDFESILKDFD